MNLVGGEHATAWLRVLVFELPPPLVSCHGDADRRVRPQRYDRSTRPHARGQQAEQDDGRRESREQDGAVERSVFGSYLGAPQSSPERDQNECENDGEDDDCRPEHHYPKAVNRECVWTRGSEYRLNNSADHGTAVKASPEPRQAARKGIP